MTLACGAVGGAVFAHYHAPLPWMLGAMAVVTVLAMSGVKMVLPPLFRRCMMSILGVMLGSAFTLDVLEHARHWWLTILGMVVLLAIGTGFAMWFLRKAGGFDWATAFFSAAPGGLNDMAILGPALGADDRVITLVHATRVLVVVMTLPPAFRIFAGYTPPADLGTGGSLGALGLPDYALLTAAAVGGLLFARALRFPAWQMTGPLLFSAIIHMLGWTHARPPFELVAFAQVVIGCGVGARFAGVPPRAMVRPMALSAVTTASLLALAALGAELLAAWGHQDFKAVLLAYSPGGFAEMNLIALSLGIEVAFISTHHICRLIIVVSTAVAISKVYWSRKGGGPGP